jgi:hypothetical protein
LRKQLLHAAVEGGGRCFATGDGEHRCGVRPLRVLVRVQPLAEPLELLAVPVDVGELGRAGCHHRVQPRQQSPPRRPAQRAKTRRLHQPHVPVAQRRRQPQHIGHRVQQQIRARGEPGPVDDRPVLAHGDPLRLRPRRAVPGQHPQITQDLLAQRRAAPGQRQVQRPHLLLQRAAQVQHRHTVAGRSHQLAVRGEHLLVGVLVPAVGRERQQVDQPVAQLLAGGGAGRLVGERAGDAGPPELHGVRHVRGEADEVRVVLRPRPQHVG